MNTTRLKYDVLWICVCECSVLLLSFVRVRSRYAADGEEQTVLESMREYLLSTIQKTFEVAIDQAECLYQELLQCTRNKNLVISIICISLKIQQ